MSSEDNLDVYYALSDFSAVLKRQRHVHRSYHTLWRWAKQTKKPHLKTKRLGGVLCSSLRDFDEFVADYGF